MVWLDHLLHWQLFTVNDDVVTPVTLLLALMVFIAGFWLGGRSRSLMHDLFHQRFSIPRSTAFAISTLMFYLIVISSVLIALSIVGFDLRNVAIIAGALSVGVGLGLQTIANNFMSGLLLLFDRSIRVGDYVEINDGTHELRGHIEEIRVRSTVIKTNDHVEVIVPNSVFISEKITNWTLSDEYKRMHIPFSVAYGSDVDHLYDLILQLASGLPHVVLNIESFRPQLWFTAMGESSLDFELIVWVERAAAVRPRGTTSLYLREIHRSLLDNGFDIPFPQRDVHIRSMPTPVKTEDVFPVSG